MKKNKFLFVALLVVIAIACKKTIVQDPAEPEWKTTFLSDAKNFFYAQQQKVGVLKMAGNSVYDGTASPGNIQPVWNRARTSKNQRNTYVEVPLSGPKKIAVYNLGGSRGSDADNRARARAAQQRLLIFRSGNGKMHQYLLTYLPDYADIKKSRKDSTTGRIDRVGSGFSGYLSYTIPGSGKVIKVIRFSAGRPLKVYRPRKSPANSEQVDGLVEKEHPTKTVMASIEVCIPIYVYPECYDENGTGWDEDDDNEGHPCDMEPYYDGEECFDIEVGDGTENPIDPECLDPEGFYICDEEEGTIVTIDENRAVLCGHIRTKKVGLSYSGNVTNLGFTMIMTTYGVSTSVVVTIGAGCFSTRSATPNQASLDFQAAYNLAVSSIMTEVSNDIIVITTPTNLRNILSAKIATNLNLIGGVGSSFSTGPCLGPDVPSTVANYCNGIE